MRLLPEFRTWQQKNQQRKFQYFTRIFELMKLLATTSTKTHLIWLVSFGLIVSLGIGTEITSIAPLRYFKQTELPLSTLDRKFRKASCFVKVYFRQPATYCLFGSSFYSQISHHAKQAVLKQNISEDHLISTLPKIGHVHGNTSLNTDEDHSFLKG